MKEKFTNRNEIISIDYEENIIKSINKRTELISSHRIHENGFVGIHLNYGEIADEKGYELAQKNLVRQRPYPFELECGQRHRDKTERRLTEKELLDISKEAMDYLLRKYPDFTYKTTFSQNYNKETMYNERGLDYSNTDCSASVSVSFKHKDSKDILDGGFNFSVRDYDFKVFSQMADDYLANYNNVLDFPEEMIIDEQYYGIVGYLLNQLNGENLALKTSLLTGKIGEKVFSDDFTLMHDVSDAECWFNNFWDGDGCTYENDKIMLIDHGKIITGIADKHDAKKYNIPHSGTSYMSYSDIPASGGINARITRSGKTVKELLDGRCAVIPLMAYGGGFKETGEYTMPVHSSLLFDGEKVLGRLKPFTSVSNLFNIWGEDFIGVSSDQPIYNDKQLLYKIKRGELS